MFDQGAKRFVSRAELLALIDEGIALPLPAAELTQWLRSRWARLLDPHRGDDRQVDGIF